MKKQIIHCIFLIVLMFSSYIHSKKQQSIPERKIVVVIPSYNNALDVTRECLKSVLMQEYSNFQIVFSDDCSPQPDVEKIHRKLIAELDVHKRVTYRRNASRCGPIGNQWHAFHSINPDNIMDNREIIIVNVDGDDFLLCKDALQLVNRMHHDGAWVTYGQFSLYPPKRSDKNDCHQIPRDIIATNKWRSVPGGLATSHLRTYRLSLLKDLPLESYLYKGIFYPAAGDTSLMWSLCEKAGFHTKYNSKAVYGYRSTNQNETKIYARKLAEYVAYARAQMPFQPLKELPIQLPADQYQTDLIIFSFKRPLQLYALLESLEEYVDGLSNIFVIYRADDQRYEEAYNKVKADFGSVHFIRQSVDHPEQDFKHIVVSLLENSPSDYIMFATDDDLVKDYISIQQCTRCLQKTHAYGFYLRLGMNIDYFYMLNRPEALPYLIDIDDGIKAWQFECATDEWAYAHTVDMTIYAKEEIKKALYTMNYSNPNTLEDRWAGCVNHLKKRVGLCFDQSKIVNLPLNRVQNVFCNDRHMDMDPEELFELFNKGFKMDRRPFYQWNNRSVHAECQLKFIKR